MVKVRNPPSPAPSRSTPGKRKLSESPKRSASSSKRRLSPSFEASRFFSRESSPGKNVHFGRNLIQGLTISDPVRRSLSPTRSALHKRVPFDTPNDDSPNAQLLAEIEAAKHRLQAEIEAAQQQCKKLTSKASKKATTTTKKKPKKDQRAEIRALFYGTDDDEHGQRHEHKDRTSQGKRKRPNTDECLVRKEDVRPSKTAKRGAGHSAQHENDSDSTCRATKTAKRQSTPTVQRGVRVGEVSVQPDPVSTKQQKSRAASLPANIAHTPSPAPTKGFKGSILDEELCCWMDEIRSLAINFSRSFARLPAKTQSLVEENALSHLLLRTENAESIRYIGCIALGGNRYTYGWRDMFADSACREALVLGIVGKVLKEHVFSALYFGGDEELVEKLATMEREQVHLDGFYRTRQRADAILSHRSKRPSSDTLSLRTAIARVTVQIETLIFPLDKQATPYGDSPRPGPEFRWRQIYLRRAVAEIVTLAADLARRMREERDVVYYWPPTFKDEEFEPARMECLNLKHMITESPYDKKEINGIERAVLREGHEDSKQAIVRVVAWPGLVAYRQHGGELAQQELAAEDSKRRERDEGLAVPPDVQAHRKRIASREKGLTGDEGFRTRVLCKSVVLLQWGKQRLLTKEAGTSRHIDAMKGKGEVGLEKYDEDYKGYLELWDIYQAALQGKDLDEIEREARGDARGSSWGNSLTGWFSRLSSGMSNIAVVDGESRGKRSASKGKR